MGWLTVYGNKQQLLLHADADFAWQISNISLFMRDRGRPYSKRAVQPICAVLNSDFAVQKA